MAIFRSCCRLDSFEGEEGAVIWISKFSDRIERCTPLATSGGDGSHLSQIPLLRRLDGQEETIVGRLGFEETFVWNARLDRS